MLNFLNDSLINTLFNPLVSLIIGLLTLFFTSHSNKKNISRERLDYVYHPLFLSIEPFLYKNVEYSTIEPFVNLYLSLEKEYSLLITPSFRQKIHQIHDRKKLLPADKYTESEWTQICNQFSKDYDKLCKYACVPLRSISYRLNYGQYKSRLQMFLAGLWLNLPHLLFFNSLLGLSCPYLLIFFWLIFLIILLRLLIENLYN